MNSDANGLPTDPVSIKTIGQSISSACAVLSSGMIYRVAADGESFDRHGIRKNIYVAKAAFFTLYASIGFLSGDHVQLCAWIFGTATIFHGFAGLISPRWLHKFYEDPKNPCERPTTFSCLHQHLFNLPSAHNAAPQHVQTTSAISS